MSEFRYVSRITHVLELTFTCDSTARFEIHQIILKFPYLDSLRRASVTSPSSCSSSSAASTASPSSAVRAARLALLRSSYGYGSSERENLCSDRLTWHGNGGTRARPAHAVDAPAQGVRARQLRAAQGTVAYGSQRRYGIRSGRARRVLGTDAIFAAVETLISDGTREEQHKRAVVLGSIGARGHRHRQRF